MAQTDIINSDKKIELVVKDIIASSTQGKSRYMPGKQLLTVLAPHEVETVITQLQTKNYLRAVPVLPGVEGALAYDLTLDLKKLSTLLKPEKSPPDGVKLNKAHATLNIKGTEIKLGRGLGEKTLQYYVCQHCITKPDRAIPEIDIMESYKPDYIDKARGRAVRDAVIKLNSKIEKATGTKNVFIFSKSTVTFDSQKIKN